MPVLNGRAFSHPNVQSSTFALALGIAIQNFPEGAVIFQIIPST
jgi:zinc transporter ZupT